jgi:hypothetical protein
MGKCVSFTFTDQRRNSNRNLDIRQLANCCRRVGGFLMAMIDIKALLLLPPENIKVFVFVILVNWRGVSGERKNGHPFFVLDVGQMLIPSDG